MLITELEAPTLKMDVLHIDATRIKKAAFLVGAVNHPVRQKMLQTIAGQGEMQVSNLYEKLHLSQGAASMHLKVLRKAEVVSTRREWNKVWYAVRYDRLTLLHQSIQKFLC